MLCRLGRLYRLFVNCGGCNREHLRPSSRIKTGEFHVKHVLPAGLPE